MDFNMIRNGIFSGYLLLASWQDFRKKEVQVWVFWIGLALAAALYGWKITDAIAVRSGSACLKTGMECMAGSLVGILLLAVGKITGGGIGSGDGWFFVVSGLMLGPGENCLLLCVGIMLCGIWALGSFFMNQVCRNKDVRKMTLPFLPFVLASWFGMMAAGWQPG